MKRQVVWMASAFKWHIFQLLLRTNHSSCIFTIHSLAKGSGSRELIISICPFPQDSMPWRCFSRARSTNNAFIPWEPSQGRGWGGPLVTPFQKSGGVICAVSKWVVFPWVSYLVWTFLFLTQCHCLLCVCMCFKYNWLLMHQYDKNSLLYWLTYFWA